MADNLRPLAVSQVHTTPIGDELMVHVVGSDETHLLGAATAAIWRRCDGDTSPRDLEAVFADQPAELRPELVQLALDHLERSGLVEHGGSSSDVQREHRRQFLKRAAIAAIAMPSVTTIVTATPAAAASPTGCTTDSNCAVGHVCVAGNCQAPGGPGASCEQDTDCSGTGATCVSGTCRSPQGGGCTLDSHCANGAHVCNSAIGGGTCQPKQGATGQCGEGADCTSGICQDGTCRNENGGECPSSDAAGDAYCRPSAYCTGSSCVAQLSNGSNCARARQCQSGNCHTNGKCNSAG